MKKAIYIVILMTIAGTVNSEEQRPIDAVDARQSYYRILEYNIGQLAVMAKGDVDYDAVQAQTFAANLMTMGSYSTETLYPPGTSKDDLPGRTRALPNIWSDFPGVHEKGTAFAEALQVLNETAGAGQESLGAAVEKLGGTCVSCHETYVAEEF